MVVYLVAFALTILFIQRATFYYNKISKLKREKNLTESNANEIIYTDKQARNDKLRYYILFVLALFPLFFVAAVRYDVGTDFFYTYVPNFYKILNGEMPYSELGFNVLNKFIQLFTSNPQWLFVVTAFIFTFVLLQTIIKYSENVSLSVIVVLLSCIFFVFLNNMRQSIAVVFFLRAFPYIVKDEFLKYTACIFLGCLFHLSAILMIIPCIFVNLKFFRKNFLAFAIIITLCLPVLCQVMKAVLIYTKYSYFFESDFNNNNANSVNIIYNFIFFVMSYIVLKDKILKDKVAYALLVMQFLAFWVSSVSLFISISEMIARITVYFQVFQILLIPYCVKSQDDKAGKVIYLSSYLLAYGVYLLYFIILKGYHQVLPYHWIF